MKVKTDINEYTLSEQAVTLDYDLTMLHYMLLEMEEYDNPYRKYDSTQIKEMIQRIQTFCYRLERDLKEVSKNIDVVIEVVD